VNRLINTLKKYRLFLIVLAAIIVFLLLTFTNLQYTKINQGGEDFYSNWKATRSFLLEGTSPYSQQTTQDIQAQIYGRNAEGRELEYKFSVPLYGIILYSPFAFISNFSVARALWMTILEIAIIFIILLSLRLTYWKTSPLVFSAFLLFGLFGFNGIIPILNGNLTILITLMVIIILLAIRDKQDEIAGLVLAFITINPTPVFLFLIFILLWAIFNRRMRVITWFLGTFVLLVGFSIAIIPNWLFQFLRNFIDTYKAVETGSPGSVLISRWGDIGSRLAIIISVLIGILLIVEWWQAKMAAPKRFVWIAMITLALSTWSGIKYTPVNYVILYPALILGLELINERWKQHGNAIVIPILTILFLGNWFIYLLTASADLSAGISSFLLIPLPLTVIFLLYWSKWWVHKSNKIEFGPAFIELQNK